jgi:hypothetical protein
VALVTVDAYSEGLMDGARIQSGKLLGGRTLHGFELDRLIYAISRLWIVTDECLR